MFELRKVFLNLVFVLFFGSLVSCQTPGYYIENSTLPLPETRKAISGVIGVPRLVSVNGRELTSAFHNHQLQPIEEEFPKHRYYTVVTVLGARRPYEINVQVMQESFEKDTRMYVKTGLDESLSQQRAIDIKKAINYSLEKNQSVDGENPF